MKKVTFMERLLCVCMLVAVMERSTGVVTAIAKGILRHNFVSEFIDYARYEEPEHLLSSWNLSDWTDAVYNFDDHFENYGAMWRTCDIKHRTPSTAIS